MTTALQSSPLRLPTAQPRPTAPPAGHGPRAWLEELARRGFSGRATFQRGGHFAEVLLRGGRPLAATIGGPAHATAGQAALDELIGLPAADWNGLVEALDPDLLAALAGLGAEPEVRQLDGAAGLRALLRDLARRGENGVLELSAETEASDGLGDRWARALLAEGRLLGAYSESAPALAASLAPLGGLLGHPLPRVTWFPAGADPLTIPPKMEAASGPAGGIEDHVIWLMSRFEGDWGRARERSAAADALRESLVRLLESLLTLAETLEGRRGEVNLDEFLANPIDAPPRAPAEVDERLERLAADRACSLLVELVADALQRVVLAFPDPNLTECCRQAAQALRAELRAVAAPNDPDVEGASA